MSEEHKTPDQSIADIDPMRLQAAVDAARAGLARQESANSDLGRTAIDVAKRAIQTEQRATSRLGDAAVSAARSALSQATHPRGSFRQASFDTTKYDELLAEVEGDK